RLPVPPLVRPRAVRAAVRGESVGPRHAPDATTAHPRAASSRGSNPARSGEHGGPDGGAHAGDAAGGYRRGMTIAEALLGFAVVAGLLPLIPGLDTALVLRSSLTRSRGYAVATALGIQVGVVVWGIAAAVGATALLAASEFAYD